MNLIAWTAYHPINVDQFGISLQIHFSIPDALFSWPANQLSHIKSTACVFYICMKVMIFPYKNNVSFTTTKNKCQSVYGSTTFHVGTKVLTVGLQLFHPPWGQFRQFCPPLSILMEFTSCKINEGLLGLLYTDFLPKKFFQYAVPGMSGLYIVNKPPVRMRRGWELSLRPSEPKRHLGVENKVTYGVASRERQSNDCC